MVLSEGTNMQAPSHPVVQEETNGPEEYMSLLREIQAEIEQIPEPMTPTNSSGLAPWANPHAQLSAVTPENTQAFNKIDVSPWSTGPDFDTFWPYMDLSDLGYPPVSDTNFPHWIEHKEKPGSSTGGSSAIDLRHHSHPGIDASSEPQQHTLQTQQDSSSAHPSINDPTNSPALDTVVKDVVNTQGPGSPTGSSSSIEFLYISYPGSSSQSQQHTPQTLGNTSSPHSPISLASPVRGIEVQPQRRTYQRQRNVSSQYHAELTYGSMRDGDVSHDLIKTQRQKPSTSSRSAPDIRYHPAVGSSSQSQQHALSNVSGDVGYRQAQVSGWSPNNFQDNSYLGVGPSSHPPQRSNVSLVQRNKGKGKQLQHHPVAPSKQIAPPASDNVRAARPYPTPASRSLVRTGRTSNVASPSTGPRHSNRDEVDFSAFNLPAVEEAVGYPTTSLLHEPSSDSSTHIPHANSRHVPQHLDTQSYHPIAPSKRTPPPANNTVRAARPYPTPALRSLVRTGRTSNVASPSTGPRHSNRDEVDFSAFNLPAVEEAVRYPTTSLFHEPSSDSPTHIPHANLPQVPQYLDTQSYPMAPSKRTLPPANNTVQAARPYPKPELRSLVHTGTISNVASSSTGPRHSNRNEVDLSVFGLPTVEEAVGYPTTSFLHEPSSDSPTHIPYANSPQVPRYLDTPSYYPIAPSMRTPPPANNAVRAAAQPYPKPASRSLARTGGTRNVASSSTGPRHSKRDEVDLSVFSTVEEETGCASVSTSLPHELSSDSPTHSFQVGRARVPVPLRLWRPSRAMRLSRDELHTIEFWTEDKATGKITPGTYFADRFGNGPDPNRSLVDPDQLPFPGKTQKGFTVRISWPGYKDYKKKKSIHTPVGDHTLRDVRDWVYNAFSEFFLASYTYQIKGTPETDTWRVGVDNPSAIRVEDLVLIRLRQVSKGSWVPEIDVFKTG